MNGNFHVQFLGEGVAATSPPYPTLGWATTQVYPARNSPLPSAPRSTALSCCPKLKSFCVWSQTTWQDRRSEAVMAKIFLSYRRGDSAGVVGRISDRLRVPFGPDSVFVDVDSVPLGVDFQEYIESVLSHCDVFLAVIGPDWAGQINTGRRIDDPRDWVRIEVEAALMRGLPVIPVLIDHTRVPSEADLPPSLVPLVRRNAVRVDQGLDFPVHVDRLIRGIKLLFQGAKVATVWSLLRGALPKRRWLYLAALLLLALLGIILTLKLLQPITDFTNSIGMRLVRIEPGSFQMGSTKYQIDQLMRLFPDSKRKRFDDEQPRHPVEITRPFFLGIHEVTVGQFRSFVEGERPPDRGRERWPG